jgi:hypothetical protein
LSSIKSAPQPPKTLSGHLFTDDSDDDGDLFSTAVKATFTPAQPINMDKKPSVEKPPLAKMTQQSAVVKNDVAGTQTVKKSIFDDDSDSADDDLFKK